MPRPGRHRRPLRDAHAAPADRRPGRATNSPGDGLCPRAAPAGRLRRRRRHGPAHSSDPCPLTWANGDRAGPTPRARVGAGYRPAPRSFPAGPGRWQSPARRDRWNGGSAEGWWRRAPDRAPSPAGCRRRHNDAVRRSTDCRSAAGRRDCRSGGRGPRSWPVPRRTPGRSRGSGWASRRWHGWLPGRTSRPPCDAIRRGRSPSDRPRCPPGGAGKTEPYPRRFVQKTHRHNRICIKAFQLPPRRARPRLVQCSLAWYRRRPKQRKCAMTTTPPTPPNPGTIPGPGQAPTPPLIMHGQYIKDLSFENPRAPQSLIEQTQPQLSLNVQVTNRQFDAKTYEVALTIEATAKTPKDEPLFVLELVYAGTVTLGDVPNEAV